MTHEFAPAAPSSGTNEVFVSARDGNQIATHKIAGDGSVVNPFHGDLDAIIESLPAHTVINLYPGIFYTQRFSENATNPMGILLREGDILKGSGRFATEIMSPTNCTAVNTNGQLDMICNGLPGTNDHVTVEDLTVDAGSYSPGCKVHGVNLFGNHNVIRNVRAINWFGNAARKDEAWGLVCWPNVKTRQAGEGNQIVNCISIPNTSPDAFTNAYDDGIGCWGDSCLVADNRVVLPVITNSPFHLFAGINVAGLENSIVRNNHFIGGSVGIYDDTARLTNVLFAGNFLKGAIFGAFFNGSAANGNNIKFINNFVSDNTHQFANVWRGGLVFYNNSTNYDPWMDLVVCGNTIDDRYQGIVMMQRGGITTNFVGTMLAGNILNGHAKNTVVTANIVVSGNMDELGRPYNFSGMTNESFLPRNMMVGGVMKMQFH